jgi:hypothetical protein
MTIYYHSSKIASILGINYYVNKEEYINLFIKYLYKNKEELREYDINNNYIKFCSEKDNLIIKLINAGVKDNKQKEILDIYKNRKNIKNTYELHSETKKVTKILSKLPVTEKNKLLPNIQSKLNCSYGTNTEYSAIKLYSKLTNNEVTECNKKLLTIYCNKFNICGKIDGKTTINKKEYIVEIKNRKSKFYKIIPEYEKIQLILYTKLCNNNNICFIQKLSNEIQMKYIHDLDNDDKIYNDIINKLELYNNLIIKLQNNESERRKFLSLDNTTSMYMYLKNILNFLPYKVLKYKT